MKSRTEACRTNWTNSSWDLKGLDVSEVWWSWCLCRPKPLIIAPSVCVYDIQTTEQCVLGGWFAHSLLCNVCEQSRQETPSTCRWQRTDCTHRYVQQTLFNMVYMQNIHVANQATTQRWSHCNQRRGNAETSCLYMITHSAFLSLPRTLMLTSMCFLEIHLHTVA